MIKEITSDTLVTYEYPPDGSKLTIVEPYDGCTMGCPYCFQRDDENWNQEILVKTNIVDLIQRDLQNWDRNDEIFVGSRCDPYMPIEEKYGLTRKCLEALHELDFSVFVATKSDSDLVFRVVDVIKRFGEKCTLVYGLTNLNQLRAVANSVEIKNIEIVNRLHAMGVKVFAFITPVLPGITDVETMIKAIDSDVPVYLDKLRFDGESVPGKTMKMFVENHYPELLVQYQQIIDNCDDTYMDHLLEKYKTNERVTFVFDRN